jgi:hypothetical protein
VPARRPSCCAPPISSGRKATGQSREIYRAPIPCGP